MAHTIPYSNSQIDSAIGRAITNGALDQRIDKVEAIASRPNLLDNPWFNSGNVVNQRGITEFTGSGTYGIDRWKFFAVSGGSMSLTNDGINIVKGTSSYQVIRQEIEPTLWSNLLGKTVTTSVLLANGTLYTGTTTVTNGSVSFLNVGGVLQLDNNSAGNTTFRIVAYSSMTIKAVKLEIGNGSTLALDSPPNYADELARCQRYYCKIASTYCVGVARAANYLYTQFISFPVKMRATPSITVSSLKYYDTSWKDTTSSALGGMNNVDGFAIYGGASSVAINTSRAMLISGIEATADL